MRKNVKIIINALSKRQKQSIVRRKKMDLILNRVVEDAHYSYIGSRKILLELTGMYFHQALVDGLLKRFNKLCLNGYSYIIAGFSDERHTVCFKMVKHGTDIRSYHPMVYDELRFSKNDICGKMLEHKE